jgi:hypothetical protein
MYPRLIALCDLVGYLKHHAVDAFEVDPAAIDDGL